MGLTAAAEWHPLPARFFWCLLGGCCPGWGPWARPGGLPVATGSRTPGGPGLAHPAACPPEPRSLPHALGGARPWVSGGAVAHPGSAGGRRHARVASGVGRSVWRVSTTPPGGTIKATGVAGRPVRGPRGSGRASESLLAARSSTPRSRRAQQVSAPVETEACWPQLCFQVVAWVPRDRLGAGASSEGGFPPWPCLICRGGHVPQRGRGLAPGRPGSQGSCSSPDEVPGISRALVSPPSSFSRGSLPPIARASSSALGAARCAGLICSEPSLLLVPIPLRALSGCWREALMTQGAAWRQRGAAKE